MELIINKISVVHYLILAATLFAIGATGLLLDRRNVINILMCIEIMLLAANINFVAFSSHFGSISGQIASIIVLTIAAAEASIGLAIIVVFYRNRGTIFIDEINGLRG